VSALTQEQVGAVYDRIENERIREIGRMSDAEIEAEIQKMLLMYRVPQTLEKALPQVIEGR
jgi:CRISPR/Cas system CSM-associated protein Csm2 small subunit